MSISSAVRKAGPFVGNGVTTAFPFAFKVFSTADLLVVRADTNGAEYTLVLGTDYTVSLNADQNANPGGTVTKTTALATGDSLAITSQVAATQPTHLTNSGGFYPNVINDALDRLTIISQQIEDKADRAIKVTLTSNLTPDEFVEELQQGASEASLSASAALASAAAAEASAASVDAVNIVHRTGDESIAGVKTFTNKPVVPSGASGAEVPQAQEVVLKTGASMSGHLSVPSGATGAQAPQAQEVIRKSADFASSAENAAGTVEQKAVDPLGIREALNATSSTAPIYALRAWAVINATTGAIRASGNVASVSRLGAGRFQVSFSTSAPNQDYLVLVSVNQTNGAAGASDAPDSSSYTRKQLGSVDVTCWASTASSPDDMYEISVGIHW